MATQTNRWQKQILLLSVLFGWMESSAGSKVLPPASGVYHGAFPYFGATEDKVSSLTVRKFNSLVGKKLAWAYFSNNWFHGIQFPSGAVRSIYRTGAVPFIRIMPRRNFDWTDTMFTLQKIIDGQFDKALTRWAINAKRTNIPLMVEFAGEMNGDWFPWSGLYNGADATTAYGDPTVPDGPERYRDAYRHIIELFRSQEVQNITWVFHTNAESNPIASWNAMAAYYPGDDYIDWIGESAYGSQIPGFDPQQLSDVLDASYPELALISTNKPLAVLEYGVVDDGVPGEKAAWLRAALDSIKANRYPRIKGIGIWHSRFVNRAGTISNMRVDSSPDALLEYKTEIADPFFVSTPVYSLPAPSAQQFLAENPVTFKLDQNFPNPFNPTTTISFELGAMSTVTLKVYNMLGQEVATLLDGESLDDGQQEIEFDGSTTSSGTYFYRLVAQPIEAGKDGTVYMNTRRMMLVK